MSQLSVRKGEVKDLEPLKEMMLLALETDPDAFSVTLEEYESNSTFWWDSYLLPFLTHDRQEMFFGEVEEQIVTMGGVLYEDKAKKQHIASIVWVYTKPEFRGKGYSKTIMELVFKELKAKPHIKKISLMVASRQSAAVELYKRFGFDLNGVLKKDLKAGNEYIDVYVMEKQI